MKIIDILNKMAKGELEDGFEFKYDNDTYKYNKKEDKIVSAKYGVCLGNYYKVEGILNNEVEVIEENKEIEELEFIEETVEYCDGTGYTDTKPASTIDIHNKINELVRAVNKLNKEREGK